MSEIERVELKPWTTHWAWTPGAGTYRHYPPFANVRVEADGSARLTVRGSENLDGEHPATGAVVAIDLPPDEVAKLASALTRIQSISEEVVERYRKALEQIATANVFDETTPHPGMCAGIAREALRSTPDEATK